MSNRILLLALSIVALSSCSVYKSGQTPDDVYYSPAPVRQQADSYVDVNQPKQGSNYQSYDQYQDSYRDDRFLRMSVGNPYYLNSYNSYSGFDWRYNSYYDGFNYGFSSPWNNYFAWNNFYNPYNSYFGYGGGLYLGGGYYGGGYGGGYYNGIGGVKYTTAAPISRPRIFNVSNYSNSRTNTGRTYLNGNYNNNNNNARYNNGNTGNNRNNSYYNTNNNARSTYTPANNSNNNNSYSPSRSYTPSSGGGASSGGSGSSSGGGGVSRPSRGN